MPKLPSYQDVGNVSPGVMRDPGVTAPKEAFQSSSGIIAKELAPGIGVVADAVRKEENRIDLATVNSSRVKLLDLETEQTDWLSQQKGENVFTAKAQINKNIETRLQKIQGEFTNDRQRNAFKEVESEWRASLDRTSSRYVSSEIHRHYDDVDNKLLETSSRAAQKAAGLGEFDRVQQEWMDQEKVIAGYAERKGLNKVQLDEALFKRKSDFHSGIALQLLSDNNLTKANYYFQANRNDIDTESQLKLSSAMRSKAHEEDQAIAKEGALQASNLEISVHKGTAIPSDIEKAFSNKIITGAKRTDLYLALDAALEKREKKTIGMQAVQYSVQTGIPLDWKEKDNVQAVDDYYAAMVGTANPFDPAVIDATASLVKNTVIVPTPVRSMIRSLARSGDTQHAVAAAELVARLHEANPQALSTIPEDERAFSLKVSEAVAAGTNPQVAVDLARTSVYKTSPEEVQKLKETYNTKDFRSANLSKLNDLIDKDFDRSIFRSQPNAPAGMQGEFESLTEQYFTKTRDADQARTLAWRDLKHTWGVTDINGGGLKMMKYAPETLYWNGEPNKWMRPQLEVDAKPFLPKDTKPESVIIVADHITARSRQPSYAVMYRRADGLDVPLLDDKNQPARWTPDYASSPEGKKSKDEQAKTIDAAREAP